MASFRRVALSVLALGVLGTTLHSRLRPRPDAAVLEEAVVPELPVSTPRPADVPPGQADVGPVIERAFGGRVTPGARAAFAVGDFDGDDAADLAVAVDAPDAPGRWLAVVHGVAGSSWSDAASERRAFLVRQDPGPAVRVVPIERLPAAIRMRVTRAHVGDAVAVRRPDGFVFWNGAAYVWEAIGADGAGAVRDGERRGLP